LDARHGTEDFSGPLENGEGLCPDTIHHGLDPDGCLGAARADTGTDRNYGKGLVRINGALTTMRLRSLRKHVNFAAGLRYSLDKEPFNGCRVASAPRNDPAGGVIIEFVIARRKPWQSLFWTSVEPDILLNYIVVP